MPSHQIFPLLYLFLAGFFAGIAKTIGKKIARDNHQSTSYVVASQLIGTIFALPLLLLNFSLPTSLGTWVMIFLSCIAYACCVLFIFKAYKLSDISIVSIFERLSLIGIWFGGVIVFHEILTFRSVIGVMCIIIGSIIVLVENKKFTLHMGILFAIYSALFGAIATLLDKQILSDISPLTYVFINHLFVGLVFVLIPNTINNATKLIRLQGKHLFLGSFLSTIAYSLVLYVMQNHAVSISMSAYKGFTFVIPIILGVFILNEKDRLFQKTLGVLFGVLGIILLY